MIVHEREIPPSRDELRAARRQRWLTIRRRTTPALWFTAYATLTGAVLGALRSAPVWVLVAAVVVAVVFAVAALALGDPDTQETT